MGTVTKTRFVILLCTACVLVLLYLCIERETYMYDRLTNPQASTMKNDSQHAGMTPALNLKSEQVRNYNYTANNGNGGKKASWWEQSISSDHQLPDLRSLSSPSKSRVDLIDLKDRYFVGDIVTVQINVKDNQSNQKTMGGEHIRVWATGTGVTGAVGTVVDNGDGTYTGGIELLWAGDITIKAKIVAQREQIVTIFQKIRKGIMSKKFFGEFRNGSVSEMVRCSGSQMLSRQWNNSCNLTSMNNGLPWFCQRPKRLSCSSWTFHKTNYLNKSDVERLTYPWVADTEEIPPGIHVLSEKRQSRGFVPGEDRLSGSKSLIPCNKVSPITTWNARTPVGYAKDGKWFPTFCSSSFDGSSHAVKVCLKGKRLWLNGDSTVRQMFVYMLDKFSLQMKTTKWTNRKWYGFSIAEDHEGTLSISYAVHGLPFSFGPQAVDVKELNATHTYIDSIPSGSNDIVLVHFYLHFQPEHPEVLRMSVRKTVSSLKALKQRAPNTTIVVKGPHSFPFVRTYTMGDFWRDIVFDILREEFKSLQNDAIYLNLWDLSVATENKDRHPPENIMKMLMNYFLSLICP